MLLDVDANRRAIKWPIRAQIARVVWAVSYPLFRFSPRILWFWRRSILRAFGATIGTGVHISPSAVIMMPWHLRVDASASIGDRAIVYNLGLVSIGAAATISQGAHLCAGTHDYRRSDMVLIKAPIVIEEGAWVCADAFIGPDVTVGAYAIVGARAVAMRDVESWTIVAGNPAKLIGRRPQPRTASNLD